MNHPIMKKHSIKAVCLAISMVSPAFSNHHKETKEWTDLFNGKNLSGFSQKNGSATFEAKAGSIVGTTAKGSPNSFLCTDKLYGDFELIFEVKVHNNLNSWGHDKVPDQGEYSRRASERSLKLRSKPAALRGLNQGYIYGEACGGWMTPKNLLKPHKHFKDGEWNKYRILAKGPRIQVWINSVQISDLTDAPKYKGLSQRLYRPPGPRSRQSRASSMWLGKTSKFGNCRLS
jgi:hypothetical protein